MKPHPRDIFISTSSLVQLAELCQSGDLAGVLAHPGLDPELITPSQRWSPMYHACRAGAVEIVSLLAERGHPVDFDPRARFKGTLESPLLVAAIHGRLDAMKELVRRGANIRGSLGIKITEGTGLFASALRYGHLNVVTWLIFVLGLLLFFFSTSNQTSFALIPMRLRKAVSESE